MSIRVGQMLAVLLLLASTSMVAESKTFLREAKWGLVRLSDITQRGAEELVADSINPKKEMMMSSHAARRLAEAAYISYDALKANSVPCSNRGSSYYNCNQQGAANPYNRGCSQITRCYRYTN